MNSIIANIKKYNDLIIPFSIFILTFLLYFHNLSPFVYGGDTGDLLLAVGVRGVAHPSGYPLFTLLGIIFSYLPISQPLAYKVALVSAISSSLSVVFAYLICLNLTKNKIISAISSLILAFSYIFWLYAEVAEVFALAGLFFLVLLYLALRYYEKKSNNYLYLLSFFIGLSLSHHLMILAIFPSLAILVIRSNWRIIFDYKLILKCLLLLLLGLTPYLYIPIAASQYPSYSWNNAVSLKNFLRLIARSDYGWSLDSSRVINEHHLNLTKMTLINYFFDLYRMVTIFVLGFSLIGIINLIWTKKITILFSLVITYVLVGPFFIFYGTTPNPFVYTGGIIERFYIFSLIYIIIFFSLGCSLVTDIIESVLKSKRIAKIRINNYKIILWLILLIIPIYLFKINITTTDLSDASIGERIGKDYLRNLPQNSYLFISGDSVTLNILYVQHVLRFRPDVTVINSQVPSINMRFVKEIFPQYEDSKEDYAGLKSKINQEILANYGKRFTFAGYGATSVEEKGIEWIPYGLSQKMIIGTFDQSEADFIRQTNDIWKKMNFKKFSALIESEKNSQILLTMQRMYGYSAVKTGIYVMKKYSNFEVAKKYFELADLINPSDNLAKFGLANYYFNKKDCRRSEGIMKSVLNENKDVREAYIYLYLIYDECFDDQIKAKQIEKNYELIFKEKLPKNKKESN